MKALRGLLFVAGSLLSASNAEAQAAWVVDPAGGPGSDFTNLQTAIDTAGEGDVLVLRAGFHSSGLFVIDPPCFGCLTVDGKSLTLVAEDGAAVQLPATTVRNLGSNQWITMRGIAIGDQALRIENNLGTVWLEDMTLTWTLAPIPIGTPLVLVNSAAVHLNHSLAQGGSYGGHSPFPGSNAVSVSSSNLHLYDTLALGGPGFMAPSGAGVALVGSSQFFASGSTLGGAGLSLFSGSPTAYTLDTAGPVQVASGTHMDLTGTARHLQVNSPVRVGETATIEIDGLPGDIPILDFATRPGAFFQTFYKGTYQLGTLPIVSLVLGPLPASGELDLAFTINSFGPSFQGATLYVQADFFSLPGELTMGPGSAMTILAQ